MNRKREEELMQLAFGDLRREESGRLQAELNGDPEAVKAFDVYCEMREGLKALRDVPEMQLSTERLREAILRDGLQPKRTPAWNWSWLATPIAVGACAFVVVSAMRKPAEILPGTSTANGLVVGDFTKSGLDAPPSIMNIGPIQLDSRPDQKSGGAVSPPAVTAVATDSNEAPVRRRNRSRAVSTVAMLETTKVPGLARSLNAPSNSPNLNERADLLVASSLSSRDQAAPPMGFAQPDHNMSDSNEIVRIDSRVDTETGAAKAVEVGSRNVEIGG